MTTTIELIKKCEDASTNIIHADPFGCDLLIQAAQRLRELNKPDCVWNKVGETFDTACNARYRDGAYSIWKTCPNCSGAVKEST